MAALRIITLCVLAAIAYGIVYDQVTARVCIEYFTIGHRQILDSDSPTLLGIGWGILGTWWAGLVLGAPLALAATLGPRPRRSALSLTRPITILLGSMALAAVAAGCLGYSLAINDLVVLEEPLASVVPSHRHAPFIANLWAHSCSYLTGFVGGFVLIRQVWRSRGPVRHVSSRPAAASDATKAVRTLAPDPRGERWRNGLAFVAYVCALLMTLWALFLDVVTFATNDYTPILIQAMSFAAGSLLLLVIAWRRIPIQGRVIAAGVALVDLFVLWNAGAERLMGC